MSAPARIAVVTSGPLCRNPRPLKSATALGAAGHAVTVLTVAHQEKYETWDRELLRHAPFRKLAIDHLPTGAAGRAAALLDRAATWSARKRANWRSYSAAAFGPYRRMARRAERFGADLTIVHTELGLAVGARLLRRGHPVAADFEDWHSRDLLPAAQRGRPLPLLRRIERAALTGARFASTPSVAMSAALNRTYGGAAAEVIRNVFPLQPDPRRPSLDDKPPTFFWFSQTVGPGRMLEAFFAAWGRTTQPSRICLLGDRVSGFPERLLAAVPPSRRSDIAFIDAVPPWELPGVIARYDIGLAIEPSAPDSRDLTITNKIFQYLNAGLPVLATPTAGQTEVLAAAPGAGWLLDLTMPETLGARLDALIADRGAREQRSAQARAAAETRFNWEQESARLVAAVARALERRR